MLEQNNNIDPEHIEIMRTVVMKAKKNQDNRSKMKKEQEYDNYRRKEKLDKMTERVELQKKKVEKELKHQQKNLNSKY